MFGNPLAVPQNEETPLRPVNPYGVSKAFAHHMTQLYREAYGIFAVNGILFNHESPRRGETFVTRKITRGVAKILAGVQDKIYLGNLDAKRDWGYAPEYVEGMWRMLQHSQPGDFVLATGETHSVREFLEEAFACVGLDWRKYIKIDPRYFRPAEISMLMGNASKAARLLGWKPKVTFRELVRLMVEADCKSLDIIPVHGTGAPPARSGIRPSVA
jgi:GDPmannose 4,6-dehydratase